MPQNIFTTSPGGPATGVSLDNIRRTYDFGDHMASMSAQESLFVSYLMKLAKNVTTDSTFKHMERRDQWQRRRFLVGTLAPVVVSAGMTIAGVKLSAKIDKYGREVVTAVKPEFILPDQTITLVGQTDTGAALAFENKVVHARVVAITAETAADVTVTLRILAVGMNADYSTVFAGKNVRFQAGAVGTVIGSVFAEATGAPEGWVDEILSAEGYTQIFKTSIPLVSGSVMATRFRGVPDEYARIWAPKMKEHKLDIARSMLFQVGGQALEGSATKRLTNGLLPYLEQKGYVENFTYAGTNYDAFMGFFERFFDPERGGQDRKIAFTSRKVIAWANKLGDAGFLKNTVGAGAYQIQVDNITGMFNHNITRVWTPFGTVGFVEETQLRGEWADYCVIADPSLLHYRTLSANGTNRDTKVFTNVQNNDVDGRKDMILTEAGLQIDLPECHALLKFS